MRESDEERRTVASSAPKIQFRGTARIGLKTTWRESRRREESRTGFGMRSGGVELGRSGTGRGIEREGQTRCDRKRDFLKQGKTHLEVERLGASSGQVRAQDPVHDRDDHATVAVCRQKVKCDKVVDERSPVSVCEVDGCRDHRLAVWLRDLGDEPEIEQAELALVRARRDLEEVAYRK